MTRPHLPLNALRAFESSARHLSFTLAASELNVTQAAVSQQVRGLEARLGVALFRRLPRGLALSDEGHALLPVLVDAFGRMEAVIQQFDNGHFFEVLTVGVVGTFAVGWLMPRLRLFQESCPFIDLRLMTHNNVVDLAAEGLDFAIRFGDGSWQGMQAEHLMDAPLTVLCAPAVAARIARPLALAHETLLRSYRPDDWPGWFAAAGMACPAIRGPVFDSSRLMVEAAMQGAGAALAPASMFAQELDDGRLVRPLEIEVMTGSYWLTRLRSRPQSQAMQAFRQWLLEQTAAIGAPKGRPA
ncbi:HTH-type transcriptional activator AmpR [Variovorax sp. SRS16]|uniref:LysR family transcriptional regulator n=1 Tax=Variovorax sp. SRS16 TaxID=282217 RepID=UPI001317E20A|nr:LysR family transcriptional regulator [Variovorax sp. SRS16]VTU20865.1 HTH-type transcriptional activator AmpR [Variovorax sp. SRS16]